MILAFDTYYFEDKAKTVGLAFENWTNNLIINTYVETLSGIDEYVSGEFYKRELPCIVSILNQINLTACEAIIIDGFVVLNDDEKLGLGGHLFQTLKGKIPVIGVAKNNFLQLEKLKREVMRGESKKPLYITAKGIDLDEAAARIKNMDGQFRLPDVLKKVDALGRIVTNTED